MKYTVSVKEGGHGSCGPRTVAKALVAGWRAISLRRHWTCLLVFRSCRPWNPVLRRSSNLHAQRVSRLRKPTADILNCIRRVCASPSSTVTRLLLAFRRPVRKWLDCVLAPSALLALTWLRFAATPVRPRESDHNDFTLGGVTMRMLRALISLIAADAGQAAKLRLSKSTPRLPSRLCHLVY